jgi:DNA-directed RNA polymerase subunit RPC12/RpoP
MTENKPQASCEECGKKYRVPSAERTYTCKACGGTVSVAEEEPAAPKKSAPARARRARVEADREDEDEDERPRRLSERHRSSKSSGGGMKIAIALIVVGFVGFGVWKTGLIAMAANAEKDLGVVMDSFQSDWEAGDLGDLAGYYHPDGRPDFRALLDTIVKNRGWEAGFPVVLKSNEGVTTGTEEDPEKGASLLVWGDPEQVVKIMWQFEPSHGRWYMYDVEFTPLPLGPTVSAFREAWGQSDSKALYPFFRASTAEKMAGLVDKKAEQGGWAASFPSLGEPVITGEAEARSAAASLFGAARPESTFPVEGGEMMVRWGFRDEDDAWLITSFRFLRAE